MSHLRGAANCLGILGLLGLCLAASRRAEAAWDFFGGVHLAGGKSESTGVLDPNDPSPGSAERGEGTFMLSVGTRAAWSRSEFEAIYTPYGELAVGGGRSRFIHALASTWSRDVGPRISLRLRDDLTHAPEGAADPANVRRSGLPVGPTAATTNDLAGALSFRATGTTTLVLAFADRRRIFSDQRFVDSAGEILDLEARRRLNPRHTLSSGIEYGLFGFEDGAGFADGTGPGGGDDPNDVDPNDVDPNCIVPLDPNCILPPLPLASPAAGAAAGGADGAFGRDATRRRAYAGHAYDRPRGLHLDLAGGYDRLDFEDPSRDPATGPFIRSSAGWNGAAIWLRIGWEQGLEGGGGLFANARARSGTADAKVLLTDRLSLDVGAGREVRESLDPAGASGAPGRLRLFRGTTSLAFRLSPSWSLVAAFNHLRQRSEGVASQAPDLRTNRYTLGVSWIFGRRAAGEEPPGARDVHGPADGRRPGDLRPPGLP